MAAVVRLRSPLRALAGDRTELPVPGSTVLEILEGLETENPALGGWILDERGKIRRHINVFVNGELGEAETPVSEDDCLDVLPAISGG